MMGIWGFILRVFFVMLMILNFIIDTVFGEVLVFGVGSEIIYFGF